MRTEVISDSQFSVLQGFFAHLWCVKFDGVKGDFGWWAKHLDSLGISWYVQNTISALADKRENAFYYLRRLLAEKGITIVRDSEFNNLAR